MMNKNPKLQHKKIVPTKLVYPDVPMSPIKLPKSALSCPLPLQGNIFSNQVSVQASKVEHLWEQEDVFIISLSNNCYDYAFDIQVNIGMEDDLRFIVT